MSLLLVGRPAPTLGAQPAVRPVPLAAALVVQPGREAVTAPPPHVGPQSLPVGRMRRLPS